MQRPILIISMVDISDLKYTQHITTYNVYLNCIYFLRPIQSARGIYACYIGGNNFILGKCRGQPSISLWWTQLIQHIHNISQHVIFISTAFAVYGQFKVMAAFMPAILEEIIIILDKCSNQS